MLILSQLMPLQIVMRYLHKMILISRFYNYLLSISKYRYSAIENIKRNSRLSYDDEAGEVIQVNITSLKLEWISNQIVMREHAFLLQLHLPSARPRQCLRTGPSYFE